MSTTPSSFTASAQPVRVAVIGAGLMGREVASAFGRWFALLDCPVRPELVAVCDVNAAALDWFRQVPTVRHFDTDHRTLLARPDIDAVYVAVPHHLHEAIYLDVLRAGKDLFAEKPFGIDLAAARRIRDEANRLGRFVRVSSEFPFLPGVQRAYQLARSGALGRIIEVRCAFLHSSDLDPAKPINWKRQSAQLQKIYTERPDGKGGVAACDTWDNAALHTNAQIGGHDVPLTLEMKRLAPTETNTWIFEALGTDRGVRFSTKEPKTLWLFRRDKEQWWEKTDLGFGTPFKTITGHIFEPGFPDILQQMWAAFLAERAGLLGDRFGCATPDEAVAHHEIWAAALASQRDQTVVSVG
jgi:predicted dehydrogenase